MTSLSGSPDARQGLSDGGLRAPRPALVADSSGEGHDAAHTRKLQEAEAGLEGAMERLNMSLSTASRKVRQRQQQERRQQQQPQQQQQHQQHQQQQQQQPWRRKQHLQRQIRRAESHPQPLSQPQLPP